MRHSRAHWSPFANVVRVFPGRRYARQGSLLLSKAVSNHPPKYYLVLYPLSFAVFRPCEISEKPVQYSKLHLRSQILVPRPSAVYASLIRMMLCCPTNSTTWDSLDVDLSQLVLYHLMGYTLLRTMKTDESMPPFNWHHLAVHHIHSFSYQAEVHAWCVEIELARSS